MNLEKLNKEFDEYLDEFQVVDSFSTSRVMTFQKKKKRFLLPIISICSILVIVFFVGKELLPVSDTPNNSVVENPLVENPPLIIAEPLPLEEIELITFEKNDKGFFLDGITLGMKKEELITILGNDFIEDLQPEFFGYSYKNQTNMMYEDKNLTVILSNDIVMEMIYKDINVDWFNEIFHAYEGNKYENLVAQTMADASSIRMLYMEGPPQMIYVKYTPAEDGIQAPFYTIYFKPFTPEDKYYISQNTINYRYNELTKVDTISEEEKVLVEEGYEKSKAYIELEFGDYYYLSHFKHSYEMFSINDEKIIVLDTFVNMPTKDEIDENPQVIEIRERMKLEPENEEQLQKEFDQIYLEIINSNTSRNQSTFLFGILIKDGQSEFYHVNITSYLLTLIGF